MHICHFCDSSLEGDYFRNMAAGLTKRGVRMSLVELASGLPPRWLKDVPQVSYRSLNADNKLGYPFAISKLARFLRNGSVDVLHTHLFYSGLIGVLAGKREC